MWRIRFGNLLPDWSDDADSTKTADINLSLTTIFIAIF
jgi:hypothetical protein